MVDIHIKPHPDSVSCDHEINITRLEHFNLCIAGTRAERAHHNGCAATLGADQFCELVDFSSTKSDNSRTPRQARDFLLPCPREARKTLPGLHFKAGEKFDQDFFNGLSPKKKCFFTATRIEDAVCKDVTTFRVCGKLDFINRHEVNTAVKRHGFDSTHEIFSCLGDDLFFTGDKGDFVYPNTGDGTFIILTRKKTQREAKHARGMTQHPFHRIPRLAGIGGAQDSNRFWIKG